jgi:hypothetical protein
VYSTAVGSGEFLVIDYSGADGASGTTGRYSGELVLGTQFIQPTAKSSDLLHLPLGLTNALPDHSLLAGQVKGNSVFFDFGTSDRLRMVQIGLR